MSKHSRSSSSASATIHRARVEDFKFIEGLVTPNTIRLFGEIDVKDLLYKSYMSLVMKDENGKVIGALCVNNFPNVPSIPPWSWHDWIANLYGLKQINSRNALWAHLAVFDEAHTYTFLRSLIQYLFAKCRYVSYVMFVIPPRRSCFEWLEDHGTQILPVGHGSTFKVQTLFMVLRQHHVLNYKIRRAVMEDNDDIVSLIDKHSGKLKSTYGEFYVAEILSTYETDRQIIVAEYNGYAVAVLFVTDTINYDVLNESFKLETFYGLKKLHPKDSFREYYDNLGTNVSNIEKDIKEEYDVLSPMRSVSSLESYPRTLSKISYKEVETDPEDNLLLFIDLSSYTMYKMSSQSFSSMLSFAGASETFVGNLESKASCVLLTHDYKRKKKWARNKKQNVINLGLDLKQYKPKIPKYNGASNAFAIEIAAAELDHSGALPLLLEAAFECYPKKDYCAFTLPSLEPSSSLFKYCVRVIPRPTSSFSHELYVAHKAAISCNLFTRKAIGTDIPLVEKLLGKSKRACEVIFQFKKDLYGPDMKYLVYVFLCRFDVIGFAILSEENQLDYLESHYEITTWTSISRHRNGQHGCINYFILSPVFQKHVRYFLLELHRLSDFSILYYKLTDQDVDGGRILPSALGDLLPVMPALIPEYNYLTSNDGWELPKVLSKTETPFALYISTPMHCGLPRYEVNTKIVVVGSSDVGISFLVHLLFKNNPNYRVTFNNVTLVSPHGIGGHTNNEIRNILLPSTTDFNARYLTLLSLHTYVNTVSGVMSAINRKEKFILVNNTRLQFDLLFLMCGKQYQMPERRKELRKKRTEFPTNVMVINTEIDADSAVLKLQSLIHNCKSSKYNIIVYGCTFDAYSCVSALMELGVPGGNITFIETESEPFTHYTIFNDPDVEDAVKESFREQGVLTYHEYLFIDWNIDAEQDMITSATFESKHTLIRVDCLAMFTYCKKTVSSRTFIAIHQAGLIFDGALVIGPDCSTNDPNIYAAGTMTKYPRRYYADHMKHEFFNQTEIGRKLADQIAGKLIPSVHEPEEPTFISHCSTVMDGEKEKKLVPHYEHPLTTFFLLPGKIRYLYIRKPGFQVPLEISLAGDDYGQVLTSGRASDLDNQGYFRLHLNQFNTVETITCLAKFDIERVNLQHLWGKHETFLNHLVQRFEMVMVPDLFNFFKEPWACALSHYRFENFTSNANGILTSLAEEDNKSIMEDVMHLFKENNWHKLTKEQQLILLQDFMSSDYRNEIKELFMQFLGDNDLCLPMYASLLKTKVMLANCEESPLFKPI